VNPRRFAVVFFNTQALFLENAAACFEFAQIIRGLSHQFKLSHM
jgi:hypothetical protein